MTHLEILAERLDKRAEEAILMTSRMRGQKLFLRVEYYHGQVVAFGYAADMLRTEALKRAQIDKEVTE